MLSSVSTLDRPQPLPALPLAPIARLLARGRVKAITRALLVQVGRTPDPMDPWSHA